MLYSQGIVKTINVNKMIRAGCKVKIWIADWFAQLNNKMGGDLEKIQTVGRYMIEIWRAAGMNLDGVEFLWSSEEINMCANEYWPLVMDIGRKNNLKENNEVHPFRLHMYSNDSLLPKFKLEHSYFPYCTDVVRSWAVLTTRN